MPVPTFAPVYPYAGEGYIAEAASLSAEGLLKYGHTLRDPTERAKGHTGQLTVERSRIVFRIPSKDSEQAEALLEAYLKELKVLPRGKKEHARIDRATLERLWRKAVRLAPVRTALPIAPVADEAPELVGPNAAWAHLLGYPVKSGAHKRPLGQWMALSLRHSKATRVLAKLGVVCTSCDLREPEFQLTFLLEPLQVWLASKGFAPADLSKGRAPSRFKVRA